MDVDGTLTDGAIVYGEDGREWKAFHARDGLAVRLLQAGGVEVAIISGRSSPIVARRAAELGIRHVRQGVRDKAAELRALCAALDVPPREAAFAGDDLTDVEAMCAAGWSAAPSDADPEVRRVAALVCSLPGGRGAVREAAEALLRALGRWDAAFAAVTGAAPRRWGDAEGGSACAR
jgi:3-deoxy-D-manno-octulosonate 8-phosphate phosphatase (KDO 8-P phosphatase)